MKFIFSDPIKIFLAILIFGLILRIILNTAMDSFDFYAFVMWAKYLTVHRIADVFEFLPDGYTPYPPLYYYVLMLLGHVITLLNVWNNTWLTYLIIRLPVFAADIGVTCIIYFFGKKYFSSKQALIGSAFYFLHPAVIYNTSVWGQIDSVVTILSLLSVVMFIYKKYFWAIGFYILGVITKLQVLAVLPLILFLTLTEVKFIKIIRTYMLWFLIATLPFIPIVGAKGLKWTWDYFFTIPNWYAYTSVYTYNLWAPFGFILSDNTKFIGLLEYKYIGIFLFWFVAFLILKPLIRPHKNKSLTILFAAFLLWYDFSFFATRIHSRYLIYSFGFFAPFMFRFPKLGVMLSILMIANFILPLKIGFLMPLVLFLNNPFTIFLFVILAFLLFLYAYNCYLKLLHEK